MRFSWCLSLTLHPQFKPSCSSGVCSYSLYYWYVSNLASFKCHLHCRFRWWFVIGGLFIGIGARNLIMARYRALIVSAAEAATTALQGDASACERAAVVEGLRL